MNILKDNSVISQVDLSLSNFSLFTSLSYLGKLGVAQNKHRKNNTEQCILGQQGQSPRGLKNVFESN